MDELLNKLLERYSCREVVPADEVVDFLLDLKNTWKSYQMDEELKTIAERQQN